MAFEYRGLCVNFTAGEDLSDGQYRFVQVDSDGDVIAATASSARPVGVLQNAPRDGEPADVMIAGFSKVQLHNTAGTVAVNDLLTAGSAGLAARVTTAGTGVFVGAKAVTSAVPTASTTPIITAQLVSPAVDSAAMV